MTDSDYRSILKRIAAKTGHGSPESLWHHIDLAWEEMNVWANVDRQVKRVHASDNLRWESLDLRHTSRANPRLSAIQTQDASEPLAAIFNDVEIDDNGCSM